MKKPYPTHVYVVTDPGEAGTPVIRRYRFRSWARGGATVWDRGRISYLRSVVRRRWICGTMDAVRSVLTSILADRRRTLELALLTVSRMERGEVPITDVPEGKEISNKI